ncbi:vacuolar protein sorting 55, partial [Lentinula edodes]
DLDRFLTSLIIVTGFVFPIILTRSGMINTSACVMSIMGGGLVYGTILAYSQAFKEDESEFD